MSLILIIWAQNYNSSFKLSRPYEGAKFCHDISPLKLYTPNIISNWSLFKLIFSDQALIILKRIFAYICGF